MTAEPRDVEETLPAWAIDNAEDAYANGATLSAVEMGLLFATARNALRENAELRGEVERLRPMVEDTEGVILRKQEDVDELSTQLAAAQAELRDLSGIAVPKSAWDQANIRAVAAEARLEAVRVAINHPDVRCLCGHESRLHAADGERRCTETADRASWHCPCRTFHPTSIPMPLLDAALSAAPQPEPDDEAMLNAGGRSPEAFVFEPKRPRHPEPPASDAPATKTTAQLIREIAGRNPAGHKAALDRGYGLDRPASGTPDLMAALRVSVDEAKKRRTASDEPARCEHGETEAHQDRYNASRSWVAARDWCPGPAASGTPGGGRR